MCSANSPAQPSQPKPQAYPAPHTPLSWPISLNFNLFPLIVSLLSGVLYPSFAIFYFTAVVVVIVQPECALTICASLFVWPDPYRRVAHTLSLSSPIPPVLVFTRLYHHTSLLHLGSSMHLTNPFSPLSLSFSSPFYPSILKSTWYHPYRCPKQQRYLFSSSFDTSSLNQNQLGPPT